MKPVKAVLFDLDDTLFDHQHSTRQALVALREAYACFQPYPFDEFEKTYSHYLELYHLKFLSGELSFEDTRQARLRELLTYYGGDSSHAPQAAARLREVYLAERRPITGVIPLLEALHGKVKIVIVSNNMLAEQQDKLRWCNMESYIDALIVSEVVGKAKPHPAIFEAALQAAGCDASEVVMVGDSWSADVLGAHPLGIRTIWLNRYAHPCPDSTMVSEITSLEPLESVLSLILGT